MPRPIPIRAGSLSGAPAAANSASTTGCSDAGQALAAEAGRVVHPGQPGVEPGPQEVEPVHRGRIVAGQEVADLLAQLVGLGRLAGQHSGPPAT